MEATMKHSEPPHAQQRSSAQGPTVTELAKVHQLGIYFGPYRYRTIYQLATFITLGITGAAMLLPTWFFFSSFINDVSFSNTAATIFSIVFGVLFGLIALVCLWVGIKGLISAKRLRGTVIHLYKEGFILTGGGQRVVVRWDNVSAFWQSITKHYVNGIPANTTYLYRVRTKENMEYSFGNNITDIAEMGRILEREITRTLLPGAAATYEAGEPVVFGKFSVSKEGIGNGRETLRWSAIEGIKVQNGKILVKKRGQWLLNWSTARVADTPNALVFVALVSFILEQGSTSHKDQ
jgi:hypothetical protein